MTLDQIRIFLAVAERGHVTRAAAALNRTQSAVSAAIASLEQNSGVKLFDRVGRGIRLTEAGRSFVGPAQALLAEAELATQALADLADELRGTLRIQASQTVASYWLPPRLLQLKQAHPALTIELRASNSSEVAAAVSAGTAELGFVEGALPDPLLRRQVVARDELVLVLRRDHPMARQVSFSTADYSRLNWVLREPGSGTRSEVEAHLASMGLTAAALKVGLELPSNEAVLAAVAAGEEVSMLSARAVGLARARGLAMRRVAWAPRPARTFTALSHPQRYQSRAAKALLALIAGDDAPAAG